MHESKRTVRIVNDLGLHARAASKLVHLATKFPVELTIGRDDIQVNSKSIMGVLMLAAAKGSELEVCAKGDESTCDEALDAIAQLIAERFGEAS